MLGLLSAGLGRLPFQSHPTPRLRNDEGGTLEPILINFLSPPAHYKLCYLGKNQSLVLYRELCFLVDY